MQGTLCKASKLAVTDVEIAETAASFLAQYNRRHSDPFCYNYYRWFLRHLMPSFFCYPSLLVAAGAVLAPVARVGLSCYPWQPFFFFSFLTFSEDFSASETYSTGLALSLAWRAFVWLSLELRLIFKGLFSLAHHWSRWVLPWILALASALLAALIKSSQDMSSLILAIHNFIKGLRPS